MDVCTVVGNDIQSLLNKYSPESEAQKAVKRCADVLAEGEDLQAELRDAMVVTDELKERVLAFLASAQASVTQTSTEHRACHVHISKLGKSIDKHFVTDFAKATDENAFKGENSKQLDQAMCEHFLRQGRVRISEKLVNEAGLQVDFVREPFIRMNTILDAFDERDVGPALDWVEENREKLQANGSLLEFKLHRLLFIQLLTNGKLKEAIAYATHLGSFTSITATEVQRLMGCLIYRRNLKDSPYADLQASAHWTDARKTFAHDACLLQGLSVNSPLAVSISAGCKALPALINIRHLLEKKLDLYTDENELPVEIDLGSGCNYHTTFACPILRQQTTDSNPPYRLVCGHLISRDALNKLVKGLRVKCPYCPVDMLSSEAKEISL